MLTPDEIEVCVNYNNYLSKDYLDKCPYCPNSAKYYLAIDDENKQRIVIYCLNHVKNMGTWRILRELEVQEVFTMKLMF